jgi:hypothetical protein
MARGLDSGGQGEASVLAAVTDGEGNRALHLAAAAGRVEVCRYIVEDLRLDVNQPNFEGFVLVPTPVVPLTSILQLFNFYFVICVGVTSCLHLQLYLVFLHTCYMAKSVSLECI